MLVIAKYCPQARCAWQPCAAIFPSRGAVTLVRVCGVDDARDAILRIQASQQMANGNGYAGRKLWASTGDVE